VLEEATALGYRHLLGVAHRLLAEALEGDASAAAHVEAALGGLREVGAEHELAKACILAAARARRAGAEASARAHLAEALALLDRLGRDEEAAAIRDAGGRHE
jgi:hypothetical protein